MSPLSSLLWSFARTLVGVLLGVGVQRGWWSQALADFASPELANGFVIVVGTLALGLHSQWQKFQAGVFDEVQNSPTPVYRPPLKPLDSQTK